MTHKNSRGDELFYGDKDSKDCEIAPMRPSQKGFVSTFGGGLIRFRVVGIESKRGEPKTRTLLDQALNFKAPGSKLWQNGRRLYANDTKS